MTVRRARVWLESIKDQVSVDVDRVVQTSKSDLTARGVAFDLQCEASEHEDLSREKSLTLDYIVIDDSRSHQA